MKVFNVIQKLQLKIEENVFPLINWLQEFLFSSKLLKETKCFGTKFIAKILLQCKRLIKSDDTTKQQINKKAVTATTERVKISEAAV